MKPVRLEFEGINSFSERTVIDFEKLTRGGIFGIFGDTGSGKSTILDCINFALYGKVGRCKEKSDIINYRSQAACVKFEFTVLHNGKRRNYVIERVLKKDKAGTHKALLFEDGVCVSDKPSEIEKKTTEILGVDAEDFGKCIALPQGEFAQFVNSKPSDRLLLVERLFNLSKYGDGLRNKINAALEEAERDYNNISGMLSVYEDCSDEALKVLEDRSAVLKEAHATLEKRALEAAENFRKQKALFDKKTELLQVEEKLLEFARKQGAFEELRKNLAVLPLCREITETSALILGNRKRLSQCAEDIKRIEGYSKATQERLSALKKQAEEGGFAEKTERYSALAAKYAVCAGKPEKLKDSLGELIKKREEYARKEAKLKELDRLHRQFAEAAHKLENEAAVRGGGLEGLSGVALGGAALAEEYKSALDYLNKFNAGLKEFDDGSRLYKYVSAQIAERTEYYKSKLEKLSQVAAGEEDTLKKLQQALKEREDGLKALREAEKKESDAHSEMKLLQSQLDSLKREGENLSRQAGELKRELDSVFGADCRDYIGAERDNAAALEDVKKKQKMIADGIAAAEKELGEIALKKERQAELYRSVEEGINSAEEKVKKLLAQCGMQSREDCARLGEKYSSVGAAEKSLKDYDDGLAALKAKKAELEAEDGIDRITKEEVTVLEGLAAAAGKAVSESLRQIAVCEANADEMRTKLSQKRELLKQFSKAEKSRNLIYKLKEITRGNKFLEFIANEYLYDISVMASSTLLNLTDGRYFLTYKDNYFNVGDNFDCGNLRGVNTLSGGETFLVSLSLALALSQTICAKSMKSIEFFFLDEGFGTLDSALLDAVMGALEKLKSSQFTIGVISHVEELKHRIDSKITVFKATENHGSYVQLSC